MLNPLPAGFSPVVVAGLLKTDDVLVEFPNAPKGDCSSPANEARPDAANAEEDVFLGLAVSLSVDLEPIDANGETADAFKKAFGKDD